jgi:hypothetical protein
MILRKPYALFIKHFNLIHFLMLIIIVINVYNLNLIYEFFNQYLAVTQVSIVREFIENYNIFLIILSQTVLVILSSLIMSLMLFKKKPAFFYFITIVVSLATIILMVFTFNNLNTLLIRTLDVRLLRASRDIFLGMIVIQSLIGAFVFARATGFDIKKFNFAKDLKEIESSEEDREEFEVDIAVDRYSYQRRIKNSFRNGIAAYKEHKYLINLILLILMIFSISNIVFTYYKETRYVSENKLVNTGDVSLKILESYVTQKNYKEEIINEKEEYIVVRINIFNNRNRKLKINRDDFTLKAKNIIKVYNDKESFIDIGVLYENQDLVPGDNIFLLIFNLKNGYNGDYILNFYQNSESSINFRLKPENLDGQKIVKEFQMGEEIDFSGSILKGSKLSISRHVIYNYMYYDYTYCYSVGKCYTSFEILRPSLYSSRENDVLALLYKKNIDQMVSIPIYDMEDFLNMYGKFGYDNGEINYQDYPFKSIKLRDEKPDFGVFEVVTGSASASKVFIEFRVRNYKYIYYLFNVDYLSNLELENI